MYELYRFLRQYIITFKFTNSFTHIRIIMSNTTSISTNITNHKDSKFRLILLRHGQSEWNNSNRFCGWVDVKLTDKGKQQAGQAASLIKQAHLPPDIIFTSKLTRSCQTGQIVANALERPWVDVVRSWRLNERHYGALQGRKKDEVYKEVGKEKYMFWRRAFDGCPPLIDDNNTQESRQREKDNRKNNGYDNDNDNDDNDNNDDNEDQQISAIDERYKFADIAIDKLPKGESLKMVVERVQPYYYDIIKPEIAKGKTVLVVAHGSVVRSLIKIISKVSDEDIQHINIPNGIPLVYEFEFGKKDDQKHGTADNNDRNEDGDRQRQGLNVVGDYYYLDPEAAAKGAQEVANQGLGKD